MSAMIRTKDPPIAHPINRATCLSEALEFSSACLIVVTGVGLNAAATIIRFIALLVLFSRHFPCNRQRGGMFLRRVMDYRVLAFTP